MAEFEYYIQQVGTQKYAQYHAWGRQRLQTCLTPEVLASLLMIKAHERMTQYPSARVAQCPVRRTGIRL